MKLETDFSDIVRAQRLIEPGITHIDLVRRAVTSIRVARRFPLDSPDSAIAISKAIGFIGLVTEWPVSTTIKGYLHEELDELRLSEPEVFRTFLSSSDLARTLREFAPGTYEATLRSVVRL